MDRGRGLVSVVMDKGRGIVSVVMDRGRGLVNVVMGLRVAQNVGNFLTS